jgi:hypothetical protein
MRSALRRAAWLAGVASLAACYAPAFETCAVRCAHDVPCPDGMFCGPDLNCHVDEDEPACPASQFQVTVYKTGSGAINGVVITDDLGTIDCGGVCMRTVSEGTKVTLSAITGDNARLAAWSGVDGCERPDDCTFIVNDDVDVFAELVRQFPVTVGFTGPGFGRVTSSPEGIDCTSDTIECRAGFDEDATVTLTAVPESGFGGWSLGTCGASLTCTFQVGAEIQIEATFE